MSLRSIQILSNPATATKSNLKGITHVVSRMAWYCALTEYLLNQNNIVTRKDGEDGKESFEPILQQLKEMVVALYKAILLYQMKSVCAYYKPYAFVFLLDLTNYHDWKGALQEVTDAETELQRDLDQYYNEHAKSSLSRLVEKADNTKTLLGDLHQDLREFIELRKQMWMNDRDDKEAKCLQDLFVVYPKYDMDKIEMNKDKLLDDAYKWILNTKEYTEFINWGHGDSDLPQCRLLWVKGHPGTGKTMLLIGIIRQLSNQLAKLVPNLSYFFYQSDTKLNNVTTALRSLIWMLLIQQPRLTSHLPSMHKYSGSSLFEGEHAFFALSDAFKSMLTDPELSPVYLIIDALDECDQTKPGLNELIELISTSLTLSSKVKWLVSSRPEVDIGAKLKNPGTSRIVELDAQNMEAPVNAYIDYKLSTLKTKPGYDDVSVLNAVSNEVRQRAGNTFLWVALAFQELEQKHGGYAVETIKEMPRGLSALYNHMMIRIEKGEMIKPQDCKKVLVVTSLAYRPLSVSELAALTGLRLGITRSAVEECRSFLITNDQTVYLIHKSAKDYLNLNHESRLQQGGAIQGHMDISNRSIDAMSKLRKNIYALPHLGSESGDITVPSPDPLEGLRYSCGYWVSHVCQVHSQLDLYQVEQFKENVFDLHDNGRVHMFLKEHFLHWLEALSLMGEVSLSIQMIIELEKICMVSEAYIAVMLLQILTNLTATAKRAI